MLSKQILTPFAPKFKLYDYQKFLPQQKTVNSRTLVEGGNGSATFKRSSRSRMSGYLSNIRERNMNETAAHQHSNRKVSVRFNIGSSSPKGKRSNKQHGLLADQEKIMNLTQDNTKDSTAFRFLSSNDIELLSAETNRPERPRKMSMIELPIERLLDEIEDQSAPCGDDKSEKGSTVSTARQRSLILDTEQSIIRRSRLTGFTRKKEVPSLVIQEKASDRNEILRIRRKSCTCCDCGISKKLAKANTIFLAEDLDILKGIPRRKKLNKASGKDLLSLFKKNLNPGASLSSNSVKGGRRKVANKMMQIIQMNRTLRIFGSKPAANSLLALPNPGSVNELTEITPVNAWRRLSRCHNTTTGKESLGKPDIFLTEKGERSVRSHRIRGGFASVSGIVTANESCCNSQAMSPANKTKLQENAVTIEEKQLQPQFKEKIVPKNISLNELSEDFSERELKSVRKEAAPSIIVNSARKENQSSDGETQNELQSQPAKENLQMPKVNKIRLPRNRRAAASSTEGELYNALNHRTVLGSKMDIINTENTPKSFGKKERSVSREFERHVRSVIMKTGKHIDLPRKETNAVEYNSKWFLSPKETRLPSLE